MTNWELIIEKSLDPDIQDFIFKKYYIDKQPFNKIAIHEVNLDKFFKEILEVDLKIEINTAKKVIYCRPLD